MSLMQRLWTAKQSRSALRDHAGVARGSGAIRFPIQSAAWPSSSGLKAPAMPLRHILFSAMSGAPTDDQPLSRGSVIASTW